MLKINSLVKYYGDTKVLDIDSFHFERGKKYALVGSNGSGKSTLIKILASLEKPDSGQVEISAKNIGYMPQTSYGFNMTVLNNVLLSYPLKERKSRKNEAIQLIDSLELTALSKKSGARLSGGETQRLALARILCLPRDILLLDEPTASLDTIGTEKVETLLNEFAKKNNTTVIFATHSMTQAHNLADVILRIENGNLNAIY